MTRSTIASFLRSVALLLVVLMALVAGRNVGALAGYDDLLTTRPANAPSLQRLTSGGCCTQPIWTADSQRVLFIDKPAANQPVGYYGVGVSGGTPELWSRRIANYTRDMAFIIETTETTTIVERQSDGARWTVPANGRSVTISPRGTRIVWTVSNQDVTFDRRVTDVWVANVDGTNARKVASVQGGGISGWVSEDVLLMRERVNQSTSEDRIYTLSIANGTTTEVTRTKRLQSLALSPDGKWAAYYVAFSDVAGQNGLWVVRTDGTSRRQIDPALFGSYRWRDGNRLLLIPLKPNAAFHEVWEYNAANGNAAQLTTAGNTPIKVANSDWAVSPNGQYIAFVESRDRNIWVMKLNN